MHIDLTSFAKNFINEFKSRGIQSPIYLGGYVAVEGDNDREEITLFDVEEKANNGAATNNEDDFFTEEFKLYIKTNLVDRINRGEFKKEAENPGKVRVAFMVRDNHGGRINWSGGDFEVDTNAPEEVVYKQYSEFEDDVYNNLRG